MRRKDKQVNDLEALYKVINNAEVCRVGLVNNGRPYVIPLSFGFDGTYLYFHSALSGEKVEILKQNNHICMEFEQDISILENEKPCNWSTRYFTVIIHGTAAIIDDPEEKGYGLSQIVKHYKPGAQEYLFNDQELKSVLVYKVTPETVMGKISGMTI